MWTGCKFQNKIWSWHIKAALTPRVGGLFWTTRSCYVCVCYVYCIGLSIDLQWMVVKGFTLLIFRLWLHTECFPYIAVHYCVDNVQLLLHALRNVPTKFIQSTSWHSSAASRADSPVLDVLGVPIHQLRRPNLPVCVRDDGVLWIIIIGLHQNRIPGRGLYAVLPGAVARKK